MSTYIPSLLEKFGIYYLDFFKKNTPNFHVENLNDEEIKKRVNKIEMIGVCISSLIGVLCVFPMIWTDVHFTNDVWYVHYGWVALATLFFTLIEFYVLFLTALYSVHKVSQLINLNLSTKDLLQDGPYNITNILSRTALEINEPPVQLMGIDPFKAISKKNLLFLGLLYKAKIILTNTILKFLLIHFIGKEIFGISILYEALLVEIFWNSLIIIKIIKEARLRLFGFALATHIAHKVKNENYVDKLSMLAKNACLRAIGNVVVFTKNYHPNMVVLFFEIKQILNIPEGERMDDWRIFLNELKHLNENETNFVLDLLTVSTAFDGKISDLESYHLKDAYKNDYELYYNRLLKLQKCLNQGRIHEASTLCNLDFEKG